MFLSTTFIVFCIPELANDTYWSIVLIPYTLPLLQTTLSISVYITVLIAICTWLYIRPSQQQTNEPEANNEEESSPMNEGVYIFWLRKGSQLKFSITLPFTDESISEQDQQDDIHPGLCHGFNFRFHKKKHILRAVAFVTVFSLLFNGSRWFEVTLEEKVSTYIR